MTRHIVCAQPVADHMSALARLGVMPTASCITVGIFTADSQTVWLGVEPLPDGQLFNLCTWDEPVEREPGWHSFKGAEWVANASHLALFITAEATS